jgi:plasmid replication initiation protein
MKAEPTKKDKETIEIQRYNTVVKANNLIQKSRFDLSTQQQKMLLFIISQISMFDEEFKLYEFEITDFCKICGIDSNQGNNYKLLKEQIKKISDKSLWLELEGGKETLIRWIEKPYIDKGSGTIKIKLDEDMKPYLLQLKEKFTEYELFYTLNFKSKYSIRLYEYLKSIHYKTLERYEKTIEILDFQRLLESPYKTFRDFNKNVLQVAYKEINEYSDLLFNYELKTKGRKVVKITLIIEPKEIGDRLKTQYRNERILNKKEVE